MLHVITYNQQSQKIKQKQHKLHYFSPQTWRLMYLINSNRVYNTLGKKLHNRSSTIPLMFINFEIFVYSGLKWLVRIISKWSIGLKVGTLSWNRKKAIYKSKQLKKSK